MLLSTDFEYLCSTELRQIKQVKRSGTSEFTMA